MKSKYGKTTVDLSQFGGWVIIAFILALCAYPAFMI